MALLSCWARRLGPRRSGRSPPRSRFFGANHRITIEAFDDPKIEGVSCFISRARTGGISGSLGLAEDTSDASVSCQQTGAIKFRGELKDGEEVFSARASILFKHIQVVRFFDETRNTLVYLTYSDKLIDGFPEEQRLRRGDPRLAAPILYRTAGPVTLVGGGPIALGQLAAALALAPEAIAADGGGDVPLPGGAVFRAVIGDLNSLQDDERLRRAGVPIHRIEEQESTDLEKCLYSVDAALFIGLGFLGGRLDHHLAAMNALARHPRRPVVLLGGGELCFLCPERFSLDLPEGVPISLFPMAPVRGLASQGLLWPIDGLAFAPDGRVGTSNRTTGPVSLVLAGQGMLMILPADWLAAVVERLAPSASSG